jgi:hypothetical protein
MTQTLSTQTFTYTAKSGVIVTTLDANRSADEDFPSLVHYQLWSWKKWYRKLIKASIKDLRDLHCARLTP